MGSDRSSSGYSKKFLIEETNRCVSCGLCLPHCPTYRLLKSEADSPRGRIALMSGVVNGRIPSNEKFIEHMDRCLTCRACESVCPNNVAYGLLIDETRKMIRESESCRDETGAEKLTQRQRFLSQLLEALVVQPARLDRLRWLLYLFQKSGMLRLLRWLNSLPWLQKFSFWKQSGMDKMVMQLPPVVFPYAGSHRKMFFSHTWRSFYPAVGEEKGRIGLFLGCVARLTDTATLNASIFVLNRLGYSVYIPEKQTCCGALHQHAGDAQTAVRMMKSNQQAFGELGLNRVGCTASGCCVQLSEFDRCEAKKKLKEDQIKQPSVMDISKFLVGAEGWDQISIRPLAKKIAVQDPCSLRNVLGDQDYPYQLIQYIPDAQVVFLADNDQCCGAAGIYFIQQPELAGRLLDNKINAIIQSGAQLLLTSNVGCSMHIAGKLREIDSDIEVLHPVTLLARQMGMP
ncbi:(Fe-S)-binding protein [Nitrosomonas aestuarii]|uniref:(Fe-S)-binding protein n=1 Tax=Nitrosomonas aestuarii TaxID=52441 RepID=UPI000D4FDC64|nr:(Fe-S)-binding protein [Nitrosomonas aestuarii]PTN10017.1 glycolate oxidase iron-sulfur subunit [Nitrosomonas aestuarii]